MLYKSLFKGIGLTILFSAVNAAKTCDYIYDYDAVTVCHSDNNDVPYFVQIEREFDDNVLKAVTKLTSLKEVAISNTENNTFDITILNKLKKMTTFTYEGILDDAALKNIAKLTAVTNLNIKNIQDGNVNLKPLKKLKLTKLSVECNRNEENKNYIVPKTLNYFASTLKELSLDYCYIDNKENLSSLTKVTTLNASGTIESDFYKKAATLKNLKSLELFINSDIPAKEKVIIDVSGLKLIPKLTNLKLEGAYSRYRDRYELKVGSLKELKHLKSLYLNFISLSQENIDEISKMKSIEGLSFVGNSLNEDKNDVTPSYDSLINLKNNLKYLTFSFPRKTVYTEDIFDDVPEFIYSLSNLKNLTINHSRISSIDRIVELKKLEHLDLADNDLTSLPDNLNKLKKLKYLDVSENRSLRGKSLNSNKLEYCNYYRTDICKDENVKCFKDNDYKIDLCSAGCIQFGNYLIETLGTSDIDNYSCRDNEEGDIELIMIDDSLVNEEAIEKLLSFKDTLTQLDLYWSGKESTISVVSQLTNVNDLTITYDAASIDLTPLNGLTKLNTLLINNANEKNSKFEAGFLRNLTELNYLAFDRINLTQDIVDEIGTLTKLELLTFYNGGYPSNIDYSSWENLKDLNIFNVLGLGNGETPLGEIPEVIYTFKKLNRLALTQQNIKTIDPAIAELKSLETLGLENNDITSVPTVLNTMENLYYIDLQSNPNLKGAIVDNDNIRDCYYDYSNSNLCLPRESIKCIDRLSVKPQFPLCE